MTPHPPHPTPAELAAFVTNRLSPEAGELVLRHLLTGCEVCQPAIAEASAPLFRPERLPPPAPSSLDLYDFAVRRALAPFQRLLAQEVAERAWAEQEIEAILRSGGEAPDGLPPGDPRGARGWARVEAWLAFGRELRKDDPSGMLFAAALATALGEGLEPPSPGDPRTLADLQARCWAELGNARRLAGDLPAAERAIDEALDRGERGTLDVRLLARQMDLAASLRGAQRRFGEARRLLGLLYRVYRRLGEDHLAGRALISQGIAAGYDGDPAEAVRLLDSGLQLLEQRRDPHLVYAAVHNLIVFHVRLGRFDEAKGLLFAARPLAERHAGELDRLKLRWVEGKIAAGHGRLAFAEATFRDVRQAYERHGLPYYVALSTLDLAAVLVRCGRTLEVKELVDGMVEAFTALEVRREALGAVLLLQAAVRAERATLALVQTAAAEIERLEREPGPRGPVRD